LLTGNHRRARKIIGFEHHPNTSPAKWSWFYRLYSRHIKLNPLWLVTHTKAFRSCQSRQKSVGSEHVIRDRNPSVKWAPDLIVASLIGQNTPAPFLRNDTLRVRQESLRSKTFAVRRNESISSQLLLLLGGFTVFFASLRANWIFYYLECHH